MSLLINHHKPLLFLLVSLIIGIFTTGCEEPFQFDREYSRYILIDGRVTTNGSQVIVSYSGGYNSDSTILTPINDATVIVETFSAGYYVFESRFNNVYEPPEDFEPVVGETYLLTVRIGDKTILSRPETLLPALPYDLTATYAERTVFTANNEAEIRYGHDVTASFVQSIPETAFLKWKYEGDWEHPYTYVDYHEVTGSQFSLMSGSELNAAEISSFDVLWFRNQNSTYSEALDFSIQVEDLEEDDYIGTLTPENQQQIIDSLTEINNTTPAKQYLYTLSVIQSTLSERAYSYWSEILTQQRNTGTIFDALPAEFEGNLFVPNTNEVVLGYFSAEDVEVREYELFYIMDRVK
ncbi:MAG: DUF4249 family protein [Marinoscillum sp.]|uniref:DUF4249 family protein n=1 Tax=Marinoscillum sp. TaxID=2024838 RepID=UPI0032FA1B77